MSDLSAISEIAVSYALLTVGTDTAESKIMRLRVADAARELGYTVTADEIEKSVAGSCFAQKTAIESPRREMRVASINGVEYVSLDDLDGFLRDFTTDNDVARQTLEIVRDEIRSGRG